MKPITFKESNVTFAKNQPPYVSLPAYQDDLQGGRILHCWKMNFRERIKVLFTGKLWVFVLNFKQPPHPMKILVDCPFKKDEPTGKNVSDKAAA